MRRKIVKMKSNPKSKTITLLTIGILFALLPIIPANLSFITDDSNRSSEYSDNINFDSEHLKLSAVSGKIHIKNNWSAVKAAGICTGNGTYFEPYVIEDLIIDGEGSGSCIWIENSSVYFIIENCTVYNSSDTWAGIRIEQVDNGQLINNTVNHQLIGIYLLYSEYNTVSGNNLTDNDHGIHLSSSAFNTVSGNIVNENHYGIFLNFSHANIISGNTANNNEHGIVLSSSLDNIVLGNTANNNERGIMLISSSHFNIVSGNTLIGNVECIFEENSQENEFSNNGDCTYGEVILFESIIIILVISGGVVIGLATLLLLIRKRKRIE